MVVVAEGDPLNSDFFEAEGALRLRQELDLPPLAVRSASKINPIFRIDLINKNQPHSIRGATAHDPNPSKFSDPGGTMPAESSSFSPVARSWAHSPQTADSKTES